MSLGNQSIKNGKIARTSEAESNHLSVAIETTGVGSKSSSEGLDELRGSECPTEARSVWI
jgi:hypothetical protein